MGFNFQGSGFDFSAKPAKSKKKTKEPTTDYQQRNKQEQDRRKLATCAEYFSRVTFSTEDELKEFQNLLGESKQFYVCCDIEETVAGFSQQKRDWRVKVTTDIQKVDFWDEEPTFEETCKTDLKGFMKLAEEADKVTSSKNVYNSPYFFVLIAKDDADMQRFLTEHKLFRYGDKFLNGSQWLQDIKG